MSRPRKLVGLEADLGPPELLQHADIETVRLVEDGSVRRVRRTVDVLSAMLRNGTITRDMATAGRRFQQAFQAGRLAGGGECAFLRLPNRQRPTGAGTVGDSALDARRAVSKAIRLLGGHGSLPSNAAWFVLGLGLSVREWAQRVRFGQGRTLSEEAARGIVIAALALLAADRPRRRDATRMPSSSAEGRDSLLSEPTKTKPLTTTRV